MSDVVQEAHQEFWRPPSPVVMEEPVVPIMPMMAEVCARCGTEFLFGSRFCHACGSRRQEAMSASARADAAAMAGHWQTLVDGIGLALVKTWAVAKASAEKLWSKIHMPERFHHLQFREIPSRVGLSAGSFIAFAIGIFCVAGALLVGLLTAKTLVDWQAIQFYRVEWLLGATAAFVAGILLKKPSNN